MLLSCLFHSLCVVLKGRYRLAQPFQVIKKIAEIDIVRIHICLLLNETYSFDLLTVAL
jgi:hypothetical protein